MTGLSLRLRRLGHEGLFVLIPLDHGVSVGPIKGLENMETLIKEIDAGGATGLIVHKGLVKQVSAARPEAGVLLHVSSSTDKAQDPNDKRIVATALEAVRLGCDGVSAHTNLGSLTEERQTQEFGTLTSEAHALGLPVLSMMYPRGPSIKDPYAEAVVAHAARLAEELGADIVKTVYTGDPKSFRNVTSSVGIPVLVAGGATMKSDKDVLELVHGAMRGGAAGVSIGRNVFQHRSPRAMTQAIRKIILDGASVDEASRILTKVKA